MRGLRDKRDEPTTMLTVPRRGQQKCMGRVRADCGFCCRYKMEAQEHNRVDIHRPMSYRT